MKNKILIVLAMSAVFVLSAGAFAACENEPAHEHTFATEWSKDEVNHWHEATCGHEVTGGTAKHTYDNGTVTTPATHTTDGVKTYTCNVCEYKKTEPIPAKSAEHTFSTEWSKDEVNHWHAATCGHADAVQKTEHEWKSAYDESAKVWNEVCEVCDYVKVNSSVTAGTDAEHPIPVSTAEDYCAIVSGASGAVKYYKLMNDLTLDAKDAKPGIKANWGTTYLPGYVKFIELNGNNHKITSLTDAWLFDFLTNSTIKNLDVETVETVVAKTSKVVMENVDVYGDMFWRGGNRGAYVVYAQEGLTLKDCTNYAAINCTGDDKSYNAVFVGCPISTKTMKQTLKFENCKNAGTLTSGLAAMFVANDYKAAGFTNLEIVNCGNIGDGEVRGTIVITSGKLNPFIAITGSNLGPVTVDGAEKQVTDCDAMGGEEAGFVNGPQDAMNLKQNDDGTFSFDKSAKDNVAYYVVSVGLYTNWEKDGQTGTNRVYVTQKIEATDAASYTSEIKNLAFIDAEWVENNTTAERSELAGNTVYTLEGVTYYLITTAGCNVGGQPKSASIFSVSAYSSDGKLISSVGL